MEWLQKYQLKLDQKDKDFLSKEIGEYKALLSKCLEAVKSAADKDDERDISWWDRKSWTNLRARVRFIHVITSD